MQMLHDRVEEVEAKLMGDMAYMKTGHQQEIEELQNSYNTEVCHSHPMPLTRTKEQYLLQQHLNKGISK